VADDRLVEKFAVLGREDIAEPLEKMLPYILSQDANVEILTTLLALSDRPIETMEFDEAKFVVKEVEENGVTWEEILADEPLVGDHWNEPEYSGSEDEEDRVYEKKSTILQGATIPEYEEKRNVHMDEGLSKVNDEFLQGQYWTRRRKYVVLNKEYDPELDEGTSLTILVDLDQYDDQYYLLTELDAIREILFMLSGWNCVLFTVSNTSIKVDPQGSQLMLDKFRLPSRPCFGGRIDKYPLLVRRLWLLSPFKSTIQ
jgi:gamma-tubulin complex component 5